MTLWQWANFFCTPILIPNGERKKNGYQAKKKKMQGHLKERRKMLCLDGLGISISDPKACVHKYL